MALKLVKGSNKSLDEVANEKSRDEYLIACLRDEVNDPKFSEWERGFIMSLARQLDQGRRLSEKQKEILERIWNK
ncbi:MAG TPA: hypothetical protein VHM64_10855 [Candidatus Binatia bacterium]|nr:hypothetical protein [Candidatus Binatia bacterium]